MLCYTIIVVKSLAYINTLHIQYVADGRVHIHSEDTMFRKQTIINFSIIHALLIKGACLLENGISWQYTLCCVVQTIYPNQGSVGKYIGYK